MLRAPSPEMVSESATNDAVARAIDVLGAGAGSVDGLGPSVPGCAAASAGTTLSPVAGLTNRLSSTTGLMVIRSHEYWALSALALPFGPMAYENGYNTPCTSL